MQVINLPIDAVKPYKRNTKKHTPEQVEMIARSITEFGFRQPLVVDRDNVLIIGHGRLAAARLLGLSDVPCVRADDLTEEQVKALRIVDNKTNESAWLDDVLSFELGSITDIDMGAFGLELDIDDGLDDEPDDGRRSSLHHNVFENQEREQFATDNYYGFPNMEPTQTWSDKLLRFCDWKDVQDPENWIAHFYYDDYKFIAAWKDPDKYIERLKAFKAVISPDFSLYTDFPRALQILSCYRRQWCGAYWQSKGIDVIPDVIWGDEETFNWCFDGIPQRSVVAVSTVGVTNDAEWNDKTDDLFRKGYNAMMDKLKPTKVLFYGTLIDGLDGDIVRCPTYYEMCRKDIKGMEDWAPRTRAKGGKKRNGQR